MIIDLRRLERAPVEVRGEIACDDALWHDVAVDLATPVAVQAVAEGSAVRGVVVRGTLTGRIRAACRRCLEPLELEVSDEFDLLFDPKTSESDEDVSLYALAPGVDELDLSTPFRERFLLTVPAYPVCGEACRGLCARCGANLNEGDCGCRAEERDPRWRPLQGLRSET